MYKSIISKTGGTYGIRDENLLESSIDSIYQSFSEHNIFDVNDVIYAYPSIQARATRLCYNIITLHPFIDGNKRIGTHCMLVLLKINGYKIEYKSKDLTSIIMQLSSSKLDYFKFLKWVEERCYKR